MEDLEITEENIPPAILSLLVDLSAKQNALMNMIVDRLIKRGESESTLMQIYHDDVFAEKERLFEELYTLYGKTPFLSWLIEKEEAS